MTHPRFEGNEVLERIQELLPWFDGIKRKAFTNATEWIPYVYNMMMWIEIQATKIEVDELYSYKYRKLILQIERITTILYAEEAQDGISVKNRVEFNNRFQELTEFCTQAQQVLETMESLKNEFDV